MINNNQLTQISFTEICQQPKEALFYAEQHGGAYSDDNIGAKSFVQIRKASRLLFLERSTKPPKAHPPFQGMPGEILINIASYCGEDNTLDAETCDTIANKFFS